MPKGVNLWESNKLGSAKTILYVLPKFEKFALTISEKLGRLIRSPLNLIIIIVIITAFV